MKRILLFFLIVTAFFSCTVYVKPAPAVPKLVFASAPQIILVPGLQGIYYVESHPARAFFYDGRWFIFDQGFWYASQYWKGPWIHMKKMPPGLVKARNMMKNKAQLRNKTKNKNSKTIKIKKKGKKKKGNGNL